MSSLSLPIGSITYNQPTGTISNPVFGSITPGSLDFNFTADTSLSPLITFARSTIGNDYNSVGTLRQIAIDVARANANQDHNPSTLAARGFLIEGPTTNLALSTQDFRSAGAGNPVTFWTNTNITVGLAAGTAPDGTNTLNSITCNSNGAELGSGAMTITAGATITRTVFAKKSNCDFIRFKIAGAGSECNCWFNIATGATASNDAGSGNITFSAKSVEDVGNGIYRLRLTITTAVITSITMQTLNCTADGGSSVSGNIVLLWGTKVEERAFPSTYFPSAGVAGVMGSDNAVISSLSSIGYSATQGTLYVEFMLEGLSTSAQGIAMFTDGTDDNRIILDVDSSPKRGRLIVIAGGVTQASITSAVAITANTAFKAAISWSTNSFRLAVNGTAATEDTSGSVPTVDRLRIGVKNGNADYLFGWNRVMSYIPQQLSLAQLSAMTT